ncbi:MAG TPA: sigma-70 family RNA polymerase sigma factor [Gemmatimonadaceae bacterium]|nr:sigma-70 family RNA polymerase sigma factor [Gemmatimonadaceae bacterium]
MRNATPPDISPADAVLVERWQQGDERAATLLVERHAAAVARFVASRGAREDVDELVQDTFVRAFGSLDGFRADSSLRTWLFSIARNLLRDRMRSARRGHRRVTLDEEISAVEHDPLDDAIADERRSRMMQAVARLSRMQREVFTLRVRDGLSYREIAEVLETTEGAARVHYHNAMRAIKELCHE